MLSLKLCHSRGDLLGTLDPDAVLVVTFREEIVAKTDWNRLKPKLKCVVVGCLLRVKVRRKDGLEWWLE